MSQTDPWQVRAAALSEAAYKLVKKAHGGSSLINEATPLGQLAKAAVTMAVHLGNAGQELDRLRAEIKDLKRRIKKLEKPS
jgi:hypothetical protein